MLHVDDGKVNALSFELIAAIKAAVEAADADDTVGAVVIHGREGKFSAGFDLGVMMAGDMAETVRSSPTAAISSGRSTAAASRSSPRAPATRSPPAR